MTSLIYPYRKTEGDLELRLSLRSVEKFLHIDLEQIVIVGDRPEGFQRLTYLAGNPTSNAYKNQQFALAQACRYLGSGDAIWMNDDFILLDHTAQVLPIHIGPWGQFFSHVRNNPNESWVSSLEDTWELIKGGSNPLSWEGHRPMVLDAIAGKALAESLYNSPTTASLRSAYGNLVGYNEPIYRSWDAKMLEKLVPGSLWASVDATRWAPSVRRHMMETFSAPSRWEIA